MGLFALVFAAILKLPLTIPQTPIERLPTLRSIRLPVLFSVAIPPPLPFNYVFYGDTPMAFPNLFCEIIANPARTPIRFLLVLDFLQLMSKAGFFVFYPKCNSPVCPELLFSVFSQNSILLSPL